MVADTCQKKRGNRPDATSPASKDCERRQTASTSDDACLVSNIEKEMGKKGGKKNKGEDEPETPRDEEESPAVDVSDEPPAAKPAASSSTAPAEETAPTISDSIQVSGTSETRHIEKVAYCDTCSMPFEFCEWQPLFKKCKERFPEVYKEAFPDVQDEGLEELMGKLWINDDKAKRAQKSKGGGGAAAATAAATPAAEGEGGEGAAAPPPPMSKKEKKAKEEKEIVIELNNRNKKKHITVIKVCTRSSSSPLPPSSASAPCCWPPTVSPPTIHHPAGLSSSAGHRALLRRPCRRRQALWQALRLRLRSQKGPSRPGRHDRDPGQLPR